MATQTQHRSDYKVHTYAELRKLAHKFANDKKLHCLVIFGTPGLAKTETFTSALKDEYTQLIKGRLSAFKLFQTLQDHKDALFLFDDVRRMLKDPECINLLMSLGEHKSPKKIQWNTSSEKVQETEFETNSRLCLLINKVHNTSEDLEPLFSRAILARFTPSKEEVHTYVGTWFPTNKRRKEIYKFIGQSLPLIPVADIRDYMKADMLFDMNWKQHLTDTWASEPYQIAALEVSKDHSLKTKQQKAERFKQLCGGSVAQLYWHLKRLSE